MLFVVLAVINKLIFSFISTDRHLISIVRLINPFPSSSTLICHELRFQSWLWRQVLTTGLFVNRGRQCYTMASDGEPAEKRIFQVFAEGMKIFDDLSKTSEATNSSTIQVSARNTVSAYYYFVGNISIVNVPYLGSKFVSIGVM